MKGKVILEQIVKKGNRVEYKYQISDELKKYFRSTEIFYIEYGFNIEKMPDAYLAIPFLANMLPIIWLTDSTIQLEQLDKDFYQSIPKFKKGYEKMYPMLSFQGKVQCSKLIPVPSASKKKSKSACFFSGGVDAFSTLLAHLEEKPMLITLWGADIDVSDEVGFHQIEHLIKKTEDSYDLIGNRIKTSFRRIVSERELNKLVASSKDNWWHGFQNGLGIISHAAPLAFEYGITQLYIASSYTANDKVTCASDPTIDNHIRFAGCKIIHSQYEYSRQQKIKFILNNVEKNHIYPHLHVCWITSGGKNCCICEKCMRTIIGLLVENADPALFGFEEYNLDKIRKKIETEIIITPTLEPFWKEIIEVYISKKEILAVDLNWLVNLDMKYQYQKKIKRVLKGGVRKITRGWMNERTK